MYDLPELKQPASRFYKLSHAVEDIGGRLTYVIRATLRDANGVQFELTWQQSAVKAAFDRAGFREQLAAEGPARLRNKLIDLLDKGVYRGRDPETGQLYERSVTGILPIGDTP